MRLFVRGLLATAAFAANYYWPEHAKQAGKAK